MSARKARLHPLMLWTEFQIKFLTDNWPLHSAAWIADALGTSRNSVIGKAWRLKLQHKRKNKNGT